VIRWVSPSWTDVIGVHPNDVHGRPIADFLLSNKTAFAEAVEYLKQDDSRSQRIRFTIQMGSLSKFAPKSSAMSAAREENVTENDADVVEEERKLELEGQGILVYDRTSGGKPHVGRPMVWSCSALR
jgi:serine/threonine-protein kinase RIM15